jgi:hypothetical protein
MAKTAPATSLYANGTLREGSRLLGQVRDGFDAGVGEHRHRYRNRQVRPRGRHTPVHVVDEHLRVDHEYEAEDHEEDLRDEVDDREHDAHARRLLHAHRVQDDEDDDHDDPPDDVPRVLLQRLPEDGQVVRHEEGRRRDRDHVDEHLRPGRAEGDDLVERMPCEAGRAAGLRVADGALGVRRGGGREDHAGDHEHERRQAERVDSGQAERVVDRRADVAVRRREQRGRSEHPLERLLLPAPARHRRRLYSCGRFSSRPATAGV